MVAGMIDSNCTNKVSVKESDVNKAVSVLYQSIEGLESRIQLLITRLNSVLCTKPRNTEQAKDNELNQCSLAKSIRGAVAHLDSMQTMVNDTIDDLEI